MIRTTEKGLAAERMDKIANILRERRIARVSEMARIVGASEASVRRDLIEMERRGLLRRVHGGAMATGGMGDEPVFDDKTAMAAREKQRIAEAALSFVKNGDFIYLDGGSTVLALARLLTDRPRLTVATNSLRVAQTFAASGPRTILVGGELRRISQTFVGCLARPLLEKIHFDAAFMGTVGLTVEGMTTTDPGEADTKALVMSRSARVILLADSRKIGTVSFVSAGSLDLVDTLITDSGAQRKHLEVFKKKGIKVIAV